MGGIGQVSEALVSALGQLGAPEVVTVKPGLPSTLRGAWLAARLSRVAPRARLVLYEHRGLALVHAALPLGRATPYAIFLHGVEIWRPLSTHQRRAVERASFLLANSRTTVLEARRHNPWLPDVTVVPLGVSVPHRPRAPGSEPLAVLVGRLDPGERYKGHDEILDAWPAIRQAVPSARFVIIGDGADRPRLEARVRAEGLRGVELTGFVTRAEKEGWLERARFAFALGRCEGFGLANVEAAACGVPLLGLRGTVLDELFPDEVGVRFLRDATPASIARGAIALFTDADAADALGARGRDHVLSHYTLAHFEQRSVDALRAKLTRRDRAATVPGLRTQHSPASSRSASMVIQTAARTIVEAAKGVLKQTVYRPGQIARVLRGPLRGHRFILRETPNWASIVGRWEPEATRFYRLLIGPGDVVWDCGANVGIHTLLFAKLVGRGGSVVAIEPLPSAAEDIRLNCALNGVRNVFVLESAVSDARGRAVFQTTVHSTQGSLTGLSGHSRVDDIEVAVTTLDEIARSHGAAPDFIKMDIEGAEGPALSGFSQVAQSFPTFAIDLHSPEQDRHVGAFFARHGYHVYRIGDQTARARGQKAPFERVARLDVGWPHREGIWGTVFGLHPSRIAARNLSGVLGASDEVRA